ncbi:hypothetical protein DOTSEDRAFT_118962 [Dothistroma septosporum NZE10]|uniref:GAR domain-containing protein n=1 Tax=Dothistroma septosporum (strain NZE10 / CBS 128990) TaxID=675120 RepID=N1Q3Z1_DOTSN|nr:hypothetical protein DOTSEDRAFT_118962 [Dothistroma septosporum NZE10]
MSLANPFVNLPRLPSSLKGPGRIHGRSDSRSPTRRQARDDIDPLLRDLSPTTTLRAFVADPREPLSSDLSNKVDVLAKSIATSSASERALGAQAAQACLDLRTWTRELESWHWPDTFDAPEPARKKLRMSAMTCNSTVSNDTIATAMAGDDEEVYWGSLPAGTVQAHETRVDEIGQALDRIDIQELKDYVLASHYRVDSRPSSRDDSLASIGPTTEVKHLDDFTALVTATILQALPYLSRLDRLLDIWNIRLIILRQAPKFLLDLKRARTDLDHGWAAIAISSTSSSVPQHARFDGAVMLEMKSVIENQVAALGGRLDRFLDRLEGRSDTVPENWIDEFELLESAYGEWVVQAERKVLHIEWQHGGSSSGLDAAQSSPAQANGISNGFDEVERYPILASTDSLMSAESNAGVASVPSICEEPRVPPGGLTAHPVSVSPPGGYLRGRSQEPPDASADNGIGQLAKKRAAFLNDIERTNSLKPTKTPVRSFEHASNAFTRLFRKDRSPEHARPKRTASGKLSVPSGTKDKSSSEERNRLPSTSPRDADTNVDDVLSPISPFITFPKLMQHSASANEGQQGVQRFTRDSQLPSPPQQEAITVHAQPNETANLQERASEHTVPTPATYQPTGLTPDILGSQPSFPEDWPLMSPIEASSRVRGQDQRSGSVPGMRINTLPSESEIFTPSVALQTYAFDRMFVQSLPAGNMVRPSTSQVPQQPSAGAWVVDRRRAASLPRSAHRLSPQRGDMVSYLDLLSIHNSRQNSASPDTSVERPSKRSGSSVRILASSEARADGLLDPASDGLRKSLELYIPKFSMPKAESHKTDAGARASVASIEAFPRSELKTIDVQHLSGQNSVIPKITPPATPPRSRTPSDVTEAEGMTNLKNSAISYKSMVSFPSPPAALAGLSNRSPELVRSRHVAAEDDLKRDNAQESPGFETNEAFAAPLNSLVRKRSDRLMLQDENENPFEDLQSSPTKDRSSPEPSKDSLDRHVSEVLERIPAQIKFRTRPGPVTPASRASDARGASVPRPKNLRGPPKQGAMTIAPAEASSRKQSSSNDPEVKLYHLTQAGREDPIKLFVRLVGEGERLMVRVGGGWADLADYLRQYADHHGSRTVSEGGLEVQTMSSTPLARKVSGPADASRAKTPSTPLTPANATPRPTSKDNDHDWPPYSQPTFSSENGRRTPVLDSEQQDPTLTQNATPKSTSTGSSRPSTANVSRPPSRQSTGEVVGLAGVASGKKAGLPDHKAKWVEGMIERAKKASVEKSKEEREKHFNELGKAGNTRRVIFKSG